MSSTKDKVKKPRSGIALGMIIGRTGLGQTFKDKRAHRSKDYKHSWKREWES